MDKVKPDRDGWVTGALLAIPPSPPFPAFTDFEQKTLDCIAPLFKQDEAAFRDQVAAAKVVDRINTIHGFYTRVEVDRAACRPLRISCNGAAVEVNGLEHGMGILLWDTDGFLETVEGFGYGDDDLEGVDLAELEFIRLTQLMPR